MRTGTSRPRSLKTERYAHLHWLPPNEWSSESASIPRASTIRCRCHKDSELLRKEVIQPQVPLRLPCYDFTPVTDHSLGTYPPCGLAQPLLEQSTPMV